MSSFFLSLSFYSKLIPPLIFFPLSPSPSLLLCLSSASTPIFPSPPFPGTSVIPFSHLRPFSVLVNFTCCCVCLRGSKSHYVVISSFWHDEQQTHGSTHLSKAFRSLCCKWNTEMAYAYKVQLQGWRWQTLHRDGMKMITKVLGIFNLHYVVIVAFDMKSRRSTAHHICQKPFTLSAANETP